jgi:hypothetical protein
MTKKMMSKETTTAHDDDDEHRHGRTFAKVLTGCSTAADRPNLHFCNVF